MKKEIRIFLAFFLTGLVIILVSFALFHLTYPKTVTSEELVNKWAWCWFLPTMSQVTWYFGFAVWLFYPVFFVIRIIKSLRMIARL
jgi:hypothetical protein